MRDQHDPVDRALQELRSQQWTAGPFSTELENRLMQSFNTQRTPSRFGAGRTPLVALALLIVGGATFAATGGVETIRTWFMHIEINEQPFDVELGQNGQATFTLDTEEFGPATVLVEKTSSPDEGEMTRLTVTAGDAMTEDETVTKVVRRMMIMEPPAVSLEDLADVEPAQEWTADDGAVTLLYALPIEDAEGAQLVLVTANDAGEAEIHPVCAVPFDLTAEGTEAEYNLDADGTLEIKVNDGEGRERVMKLKTSCTAEEEAGNPEIDVDTPVGHIKISVMSTEDE